MDLQGKKNAFRSSIRQTQIEKYFQQKRKYFGKSSVSNEKGVCDQLQILINELPSSIVKLVGLLNEHDQIVFEYLTSHRESFLNSFYQVNVVEYCHYVHVIEALLIREGNESPSRMELIGRTLSPIIHSCDRLLSSSKISTDELLRYCFDYLMLIKTQIQLIKSVEIEIVLGLIKCSLIGEYHEGNEELYCNMMIVINNIFSVCTEKQRKQQYQMVYMKKLLLNCLFKNLLIFKNLLEIGNVTQSNTLIQQILRTFINVTFFATQKSQVNCLFPWINVFILSISSKFSENGVIMELVMILVGNIILTSETMIEKFSQMRLIEEIVSLFKHKHEQYGFNVSEQFLSLTWNIINSIEIDSHLIEKLILNYQIHGMIIKLLEKNMVSSDATLQGLKSLILLSNNRREEIKKYLCDYQSFLDNLLLQNNQQIVDCSQSLINLLRQESDFY